MTMKTEIWKAHPDIPWIEVSTLGRVRTIDRMVSGRGNGTQFIKGRVLKQRYDKNGYLQVSIRIDGKRPKKLVHRLIAQTFIKNPNNLPQVNHLDCDRANNHVENLEFCTVSYNQQYREKYGVSQTEVLGHPVFAINLDTMEISRFRSQGEAGQVLGVSQGNISSVIKGKYKQTGGYWFVNDDGHAVDVVKSKLHDVGGVGLKIK